MTKVAVEFVIAIGKSFGAQNRNSKECIKLFPIAPSSQGAFTMHHTKGSNNHRLLAGGRKGCACLAHGAASQMNSGQAQHPAVVLGSISWREDAYLKALQHRDPVRVCSTRRHAVCDAPAWPWRLSSDPCTDAPELVSKLFSAFVYSMAIDGAAL